MANYSIKKESNNNEIVYISGDLKGYNFNPKTKSPSNKLKINQIVIVNPSLTDKVLTLKFKQRYKRILMIVLSILNGADATEGDIVIVLDEIAKLKDILLNKYKTFLKKEKEQLFLEQLQQLELKMRVKQQQMRNIKYYQIINQMFGEYQPKNYYGEELTSSHGR